MRPRPQDIARLCQHWLGGASPDSGAAPVGEARIKDALRALQELLEATGAGVAVFGAAFLAVGDLDQDGSAELADGPDGMQRKPSAVLVRRTIDERGYRVTTVFRFKRDGWEEAEVLPLVDAAATAFARAARPQVPDAERFAHYELLARLGEGGMAQVHLARDRRDPSAPLVALKRMRSHMAQDDVFLALFSREVQAASRIDHPNVIRILEYGVADRQAYMVMEYLRGATLKKLTLLAEASGLRLWPAVVASLGHQLCTGLSAVHAHGLIHCDVSPPNLFVSASGVAKLIDFGIARRGEAAASDPSGARGKVGYMAPEQLVGEPIDARADLYALGVVLYEMLSGSAVPSSLCAYAHDALPPLTDSSPELPKALCAVVMSAVALNRQERPTSAEVLASALQQACADDGLPLLGPEQIAAQLAPAFAHPEPAGRNADPTPGPTTVRFG